MTTFADEVLTSGNGANGIYVKLVNNITSTIYAATAATSSVGVWTASAPPGTYSAYTSLTGTGNPPGSGWTLFNSNYIVTDPVNLGLIQKAGTTGSIAFNIQGDDGVNGPLNESTPTNGQMRFVLARANADAQAGSHINFIIEPYTYGMSMSYGGIIQVNTACLAVGPMVQATGVASVLGAAWPGGIVLAINEADSGGLFLTSKNGATPPTTAFNQIVAEMYDYSDAGPIQFVTRGASGFHFLTGTAGSEVKHSFSDSAGKWFFRGASTQTYAPATLNVTAPASQVSLAVFKNASGSADILDVMDSAATPLVSVTTDGGLHPGNGSASPFTVGGALWSSSGAPATGLGAIGDIYFRTGTPTTANQRIYIKTAAAVWTGIV